MSIPRILEGIGVNTAAVIKRLNQRIDVGHQKLVNEVVFSKISFSYLKLTNKKRSTILEKRCGFNWWELFEYSFQHCGLGSTHCTAFFLFKSSLSEVIQASSRANIITLNPSAFQICSPMKVSAASRAGSLPNKVSIPSSSLQGNGSIPSVQTSSKVACLRHEVTTCRFQFFLMSLLMVSSNCSSRFFNVALSPPLTCFGEKIKSYPISTR